MLLQDNDTVNSLNFNVNNVIVLVVLLFLFVLQIIFHKHYRVFFIELALWLVIIIIGFNALSLDLPLNPLIPLMICFISSLFVIFVIFDIHKKRKLVNER